MTEHPAPSVPMIAARWHGGAQVPRTIVIHGTVSPCAVGGARATAKFFANETKKTSAHYIVDPAEIIQSVGDHTVAYHCGHNQDSIGIELCDPQAGPGKRWTDEPHTQMLARAATLVAQLCLAYDIPAVRVMPSALVAGKHGICGHVDMTNAFHQSTHTDPGPDFPWTEFIHAVKTEITRLEGAPVTKPTTPAAGTPWTRTRKRLTDAINHPDAKAIPKSRLRIQALLRTVRAGLAATPKS